MLAIISYDISSNRQRAKFHRFLKEYGLNTQKSIFECEVDLDALAVIARMAGSCIDPDTDSLLIYRICNRCQNKVVVSGQGLKVTILEYLVC